MPSDILTTPELRQWDSQVRNFAKHFLALARLPKTEFSLLDVGCGTGSAADEIHQRYPHAKLFGCDLTPEHVEISTCLNESHAQFMVADIDSIKGKYDIIYISNVLEHVAQFEKAVLSLLDHCFRLYILVPFNEPLHLKEGPHALHVDHLNSFTEQSFSFLGEKEYDINSRILRTPGAWGHTLRREIGLRAKALLAGRYFEVQREILVAITRRSASSQLPATPFLGRIRSAAELISVRRKIVK